TRKRSCRLPSTVITTVVFSSPNRSCPVVPSATWIASWSTVMVTSLGSATRHFLLGLSSVLDGILDHRYAIRHCICLAHGLQIRCYVRAATEQQSGCDIGWEKLLCQGGIASVEGYSSSSS